MSTDFLHGQEVIEGTDGTRPIQTLRSSILGMIGTAPDADPNVFPLNEPVVLHNQPRKAASLDTTGNGLGTLLDGCDDIFDQSGATVIITRVAEGIDIDATLSNIVGSSASLTGVHAFKAAQSEFGLTPRIYFAPGFTSQRPANAKNPVMAELEGILAKHRAIAIADGPSTNDADAFAYANDFGSDRIFVVDPGVKVWDVHSNTYVNRPASARIAGLIARTDAEKGYWWSPSNKEINGIGGIARPIEFNISDTQSQANYLNENKIATIVNAGGGYRLWGNRSTSSDPKWAFLSVRRSTDILYDTIEKSLLWAQDQPFSVQLLEDVQDTVQDFMNFRKSLGASLGGTIWVDRELNTASTMEAGQWYFDLDDEPPAPLERLTWRAHRNNGYYTELVDKLLQSA